MQTSIPGQSFRGRRVLVVGLGLHGGAASAVRWLAKEGAVLRVQDKKPRVQLAPTLAKLKKLRITYHLGSHAAADFAWADVIYVNQGVPWNLAPLQKAMTAGKPIINETTIFFQQSPAPIVGITGTRGKSTTTLLVAHILKTAKRRTVIGGNVRQTMMLDLLPKLSEQDLAVLELSSFQLEYLPFVRRSPHVAVMTNLKVDHLNRYGGMSEYAAAKFNIFRFQTSGDTAVLNAENMWTKRAGQLTSAQVHWFQTKGKFGQRGVTIERGWIVAYDRKKITRLMPLSVVSLRGNHNLQNILAAVATTHAMGCSAKDISRAVKTFPGVASRQEHIRTWRGHDIVNDTTATTPDGTLAALDVFPKALFIVGGTDKQLQYQTLANALHRKKVPMVFLPGTGTEKILRALQRAGDKRAFHIASSMREAVHEAAAMAKPKQTIVLSPGAASFGLFVHEFDRGQQFVRAVKRLS